MTRTIHLRFHYSTLKHGFSYSAKHLPMRDFTIRGPLWSSSIFTSYQPWQENNESSLHKKNLGPLPKTLCYQAFFKVWHQWQPTLIKNLPLWHWWKHSDAILKLYHLWSPWNHAFLLFLYPLHMINLSPFIINGKCIFSSGFSPLVWTVLLWCFLV